MNFLAIDSATDRISLALSRDGALFVRELDGDMPRASEALVAEIGRLLESHGIAGRDLDAIGYDCGPGAFTSIRCGCAVAKAIALANGLPLIGIPSLEALAHAASDADRICCALDARMGEVYVARYRRNASVLEIDGAVACLPPSEYRIEGEGWIGVGTGFGVLDGALGKANAGRFASITVDLWPTAAAVCELAMQRYAAGVRTDAAEAAPLYVRDKVALTTRERELARA